MTYCILGETLRRPMLRALAAVFGALGSIATAVFPAAAQNGALIQTQPLYGAPDGAAAYRILYRSTGLSGEPIVVSGMVVIPQGDPPPGGRPIVAWAHPTTGVAPRCAPSLARVRFQMIQGLRDMVERGYVVTATDYPGLGTPQTHPYLVGDSEGRAVLDSVRAARTLPDAQAGSRFAVWGHSQGGQAALYTGLLAKGYAPDLQLVGVAAAAPATELSTLMRDDLGTSGGNNLTAMTLWSWARVYGAPIEQCRRARRDAGGQPASRGMHRVDFRSLRAASHGEVARARFPQREESRRRRTLALAARKKHARRATAKHSRLSGAGRRRQAGPPRGHGRIHAAAVPRRQFGAHGRPARRRPWAPRARQRERRGRLDRGPLRRDRRPE